MSIGSDWCSFWSFCPTICATCSNFEIRPGSPRRFWSYWEKKARLSVRTTCPMFPLPAGPPDRSLMSASTAPAANIGVATAKRRSEEHTSELQSLMRISYAVFCLKKKKKKKTYNKQTNKPQHAHNTYTD